MIYPVSFTSNAATTVNNSPENSKKKGGVAMLTGTAGLAVSKTIKDGSKVFYRAKDGASLIRNGAKTNTKKLMVILQNLAKKSPKLANVFTNPVVKGCAVGIGLFSGLTFVKGATKSIGQMFANFAETND